MNNPILRTLYGSKVKFISFFHLKDMVIVDTMGYQLPILIADLEEESKRILENLRLGENKVEISRGKG